MKKYNWTDEQIIAAVTSSGSIAETFEKLAGKTTTGGRIFDTLKKKMKELNVSFGKSPRERKPNPAAFKGINWAGQKFHHITITSYTYTKNKSGRALWNAICDCGKELIILPSQVKNGDKPHCGCIKIKPTPIVKIRKSSQREIDRAKAWDAKQTPEYHMFLRARRRAQKQNIPFNIEVTDINIPKFCPVLGIELKSALGNKSGTTFNSPSLDKIIPEMGYVKGNIMVISWRANSLKNNGLLNEFEKIVQYIKNYSPTIKIKAA